MSTDPYIEKLEALRLEYQQMLPTKLENILALWQTIKKQKELGESMEEFYRQVHSLAGSGTTFGFSRLSSAAKELERGIREAQDSGSLLPASIQILDDQMTKVMHTKDLRDDTDHTGALDSIHFSTGAKVMDQHVYWYTRDGSLAAKVKSKLYQFGFQVHLFDVVPDLLAKLEEKQPDVLILDFYLTGSEQTDSSEMKQLLEQTQSPCPLICLCPPGENLANWLQVVRAGADAYYTKPVDFHTLLEKLHQLSTHREEAPYRLFMIDDDEKLVGHMATILEKAGMVVAYETDPTKALEPLKKFAPDLILVDLYMPKLTGTELAHMIRQDSRLVAIPIVYLSRETEMNKQLEALNAGADDFLLKPVKYRFLYYSLSSRIKRARSLRRLMERDGLTGLLNHTASQERFAAAVAHAREAGSVLSFALIDIDNLKAVNDTYGHHQGDRLLKSLSILLERHLREYEHKVVGRFGGEELAVLLPDLKHQKAQQLMNIIRQHYAHIHHESPHGTFNATLSCGLASFPACADLRSLLETADNALAEAKRRGKNLVVGDPEPQKPTVTPEDLESEELLEEDELIFLDDEEVHPIDSPHQANDGMPAETAKILVVDDDPQMLRHIETVLGEKGFEIITAPTGDQGFTRAIKEKPQLVLIDLLLFPGIHGFELCQKIRKERQLEGCGIILMTAVYKDYRYRLEGKEAGADDFIEKPINYPVLFDKIKALLPDVDF